MENIEYIKLLLEKYFEGNTSLEEEQILRGYLKEHSFPDELKSEALWFSELDRQRNSKSDISELEQQLSSWVDHQNKKEKNIRFRNWTLGIAAGLALAIGTTFFFQYKQTKKYRDTYQDPQIAYLEAKKVLLYVSQTLNHGTEKLQTVSRIDEGANEMSIFSTFGSGLKNLELVSKYNDQSSGKQ